MEKQYYTVEELMEILSIGRNTAYKLIQTKGFPVLKIGKSYRISIEGFQKWKAENESGEIEISDDAE